MEKTYNYNLLFYNLKFNLSKYLKVIELMSICKIMNSKYEILNIFDFNQEKILITNSEILSNIDNKLYQNLVCIHYYIKNIGKSTDILINLLKTFRNNIFEFFISNQTSKIFVLENFMIKISKTNIVNYIFSNGIKRFEIFNMCCNNKYRKLTKYIQSIDKPYNHLCLASLIVLLKIFSYGNYSTSLYYLSKHNFNVDKEIYKKFINFIDSQMYDFLVFEKYGIKYYSEKWKEICDKYNKLYISVNENNEYILVNR